MNAVNNIQRAEVFAKSSANISPSTNDNISLSYNAAPFSPRTSVGPPNNEEAIVHSSTDWQTIETRTDQQSGQSFQHPDRELIKRIVDQVEFYFSDQNIVNDAFLLKHIRRNKEGYVSLKLIASFKRVKHMARDWRLVQLALATSTKLQLNEAGTKLRRKEPLPTYDQTAVSRTLLALDIPAETATVQSVAAMFASYGQIASIRILRPGNPIPADVRPFYNKRSEIHDKVNAIVEFVRAESARNAVHQKGQEIDVLQFPAASFRRRRRKAPKKDEDESESGANGEIRCSCHESFSRRQRSWDSGTGSVSSSLSSCSWEPHRRRDSNGWGTGSEGCNSCASRSGSTASVMEFSRPRRYSMPIQVICHCCGFPKCESVTDRRYSLNRVYDDEQQIRYETAVSNSLQMYVSSETPKRRWCRSNSLVPTIDCRNVKDAGAFSSIGRRRSFGNLGGIARLPESVIRLPRGPRGGRGFLRELVQSLPE